MFRCHVCGYTQSEEALTAEVFRIDGRWVLVENIPVTRCARCGEETFTRAVTERVRRLVHEQAPPEKTVPLAVFAFP